MFRAIKSNVTLSKRFYKETVQNLEKGMYLKHKGRYVQVFKNNHVKIAMRGALFKVELQDLMTGTIIHENLKPTAEFEVVETTMADSTFLRQEDGKIYFEDPETEEEFSVPQALVPGVGFLKEGDECLIKFAEKDVMYVTIPQFVVMTIEELVGEGRARCERGVIVKGMPPYVTVGSVIKVRTEDSSFQSKA